jgi:hypothetical protein
VNIGEDPTPPEVEIAAQRVALFPAGAAIFHEIVDSLAYFFQIGDTLGDGIWCCGVWCALLGRRGSRGKCHSGENGRPSQHRTYREAFPCTHSRLSRLEFFPQLTQTKKYLATSMQVKGRLPLFVSAQLGVDTGRRHRPAHTYPTLRCDPSAYARHARRELRLRSAVTAAPGNRVRPAAVDSVDG